MSEGSELLPALVACDDLIAVGVAGLDIAIGCLVSGGAEGLRDRELGVAFGAHQLVAGEVLRDAGLPLQEHGGRVLRCGEVLDLVWAPRR